MPERCVANVEAAPDATLTLGQTFYQQLNIPGHVLRTGDCVYVRAENGKQLIAQIDSMWINAE